MAAFSWSVHYNQAMHPEILTKRLNTGAMIPVLGLGTYDISAATTQKVVEQALALGYRHLDCAASYFNEAAVGAAIAASGIPRDQLFITSKVRNCDQGTTSVRIALEKTLTNLGLDYLDLYLVHWPVPSQDLYVPSYQEIITACAAGLVHSPGVANFLTPHLQRIIQEVGVTPAVNQFEIHPSFQQNGLRSFCAQHDIQVESYCPLGRGKDLPHPVVVQLAREKAVTPAQIVLAWHLAQNLVAIPKSARSSRQAENLAAVNIELTAPELELLATVDHPEGRICGDPATFSWPQAQLWTYQ